MRDVQGVLGSLLIKLNIAAAVYRRNSILHDCPILEVTSAAAVTATISYLVSLSALIVEIMIGTLHYSRSFSSGKDIEPVYANLSSSTTQSPLF